ncbi:MAG: AMP-binding protein [Methanomassiliicoccus sp.]|nr:AMP-binding protein [Methanomassiliicoccus sp.]
MGCKDVNALFLTGGTGFVGTYVARWLVGNTDRRIIVLVRGADDLLARRRLERAWWDFPDLIGEVGSRIEVLSGDLCSERFGLDEQRYGELVRKVDIIVHSAADIRLNAPLDELRRTNVDGVRNVIGFAEAVDRDHGLQRLSHVSTAYVAGGRQGRVPEEDLTDRYGFLSNYERSKYEGETLVREAKHLRTTVLRPGMVVGSSEDGHVRTFNTLYYPLRLYLAGRLRIVPLSGSQKVNLIPVDQVAEGIGRLTLDPRAEGRTFHLVGAYDKIPTVKEMVDLTRTWAKEEMNVDLPRPVYVPGAMSLAGRGVENLAAIAPYLRERREFTRDGADELLGPYPIDWRELLPRLLEFGTYHGFLHRSERTVHEQVLFRLDSERRPVRLHDVVDGEVIARPAGEVRGDMLRAAAALRSSGIAPGDRVAIVGANSVRYLVLDVAIGLVGAVSVPLYYTSPPRELDELIEASGAKLVLIGAEGVLRRVGEMRTSVPIVSFSRSIPGDTGRTIPWEEFMARGGKEGISSPAGLGDLATLRYTSSTTGRAKGVLFRHEHLRNMAESTASLPPWEVRISEIFYLSFLPMNHVVEGILATYAPFYAPAAVNLYFLEDFRGLQNALVKVRPTVFFSVPRFYEKMRDRLVANGLARRYMEGLGIGSQVMAPLIGRRALRAAGLDRCAYMISGSSPMSPDILAAFRRLGIEVHNAYGLTEAPLITINYSGRNRIGTVGEPLPDTEVRIAGGGEVLVRGPQVTCGYFDGERPFTDGMLRTGDLGHLTAEGSLVLDGRKKELIKTAYGKFVNPLKVETMLRDLPGAFEAMVVGEGRPYCTALVWSDREDGIDGLVEEINSRLSRPEKVRAWAVLPNDLSVEGGELTANMKLRRPRVLERYAPVIEAMYSGAATPAGVLHIGRARREE